MDVFSNRVAVLECLTFFVRFANFSSSESFGLVDEIQPPGRKRWRGCRLPDYAGLMRRDRSIQVDDTLSMAFSPDGGKLVSHEYRRESRPVGLGDVETTGLDNQRLRQPLQKCALRSPIPSFEPCSQFSLSSICASDSGGDTSLEAIDRRTHVNS